MSEPHDWMAGMTDLQRAEVARLESRIVSFEKRWQSLEADWNDCRKLLAAAIKERDSLKQRVAVLESQEFTLPHDPFRDPDRDLRERLVCAIWPEILRIFERADTTHNNGANWDLVRINARDRALTEADAMIAEMRKGDSDAK